VIVACAGAEEFLRNWCDLKGISVPEKQRSIARFAQELRTAGHIELPVERRICAWADYRNDAAHGANWAKITQEIANRTIREIEEFVLQNRHILGEWSNNAFKPKLHRYANNMTERACHVVSYALQFGLT
jgi:hypothetical protein